MAKSHHAAGEPGRPAPAPTSGGRGAPDAPLLHYLSEKQLAERLGVNAEQLRALRASVDQAALVPEHLKREPSLQYLSEAQLAERLGCSRRRLRELRLEGGGPPFQGLGRSPLYPTASVLTWEAELPRASTSRR